MKKYELRESFRALRLLPTVACALFLLLFAGPLEAASEFDAAFSGYMTRMFFAIAIFGALGYAAVKFLPGRLMGYSRGHIKILSAVSLGRDMIYIVKTGPEVVAFISGRTGSTVLGRWGLEEWDDYEAACSNEAAEIKTTMESGRLLDDDKR
jgi:hypothetical protein